MSVSGLMGGIGAEALAALLISSLQNKNYKTSTEMMQDKPIEGVNVEVVPGFRNAVYVSPEFKANIKNQKVRDAIERLKAQGGGVLVGQGMNNPAVIHHEIGHTKDKSKISKLAPPIEHLWDKYNIPVWTTLAAMIGGTAYPKYFDALSLANIGLQGISTLPILYSELAASSYAKDKPDVDKRLLSKSFNSYLLDTIGKRVAVPAAGYLGYKIFK